MNTILFICLEIAIIYGLTFVLLWINNKAFKVLKQSNIFKARQSIFTNVQANIRFILIILSTLAACAVLVFNFWLFYQNKYIPGYTRALFQKFSPENWLNIGLAIFKTLIIFGLINYLKTPIIYGLTKACVFVQDLDDIEGNDESIAKFFATAQTAIINSLWLIGLNLALLFLNFPEILIQGNYTLVKIYAIFSLGTLILRSVSIVIDSLDHLSIRFSQSNHIVQIYQQFRHLLGFLRKCLETAIAILFTTFAIKQIEVIADLATFGEKLVKVVAIVGISRVLVEISKIMITKLIFIDGNQDDNTQEYKMKSTFVPLIQSIVKYLIFFFSGIFILYALGINPLPILAAAGILGVGISLGAQTLIKDIIAGFFILFEGNFFVGDFVKINNNIVATFKQ